MAGQRSVGTPVPSEEARVPGKLEKCSVPCQSRRRSPGDPGAALSHVPPSPFSHGWGDGRPTAPVPGERPQLLQLADAWVSPASRWGFFAPLLTNDAGVAFTASQSPRPSCRAFGQASVSGGLTLAGGHFAATWRKAEEHVNGRKPAPGLPALLSGEDAGPRSAASSGRGGRFSSGLSAPVTLGRDGVSPGQGSLSGRPSLLPAPIAA